MRPEPVEGLRFRSADGRFGLTVAPVVLGRILRACRRAGPVETGGVLVGRYTPTHDRAVVTAVSAMPGDSRRGRTWFARGVRGLQGWLDRAWRERGTYYLGEWHFHPLAPPAPSPTDIAQMVAFAEAEGYHCPEPVLLIIGGDPRANWQATAQVFPRECEPVELLREDRRAGRQS